jgi:hypothetical protein
MTGKNLRLLAAVGAACGALGFLWGRWSASLDPDEAAARYHLLSQRERLSLERQRDQALAESARLRRELADARRRLKSVEAPPAAAAEPTPGEAAAAGAFSEAGPAVEDAPAIDWDGFARLFDDNHEFLAELAEDKRQPSAEETARLFELIGKFSRVLGQAKALSDAPLFEAEILGGFLRSVYAGPLQLSEAQLEQLRSLSGAALERELAGLDLEALSPIEYDRANRRLLDGAGEALRGILDDSQRRRLDGLEGLVGSFFGGARSVVELGLEGAAAAEGPGAGEAPSARIYRHWHETFQFSPEQQAIARQLAGEYVGEARALLDRYGQGSEGAPALDQEQEALLEEDLFQLQVRMERNFLPRLAPEQLRAARQRPPLFIRFRSGSGGSISHSSPIGW